MFLVNSETGKISKVHGSNSERVDDAMMAFNADFTATNLFKRQLAEILAVSFILSNDGCYNGYNFLIKPASFQSAPAVYVEKPSKSQQKKMRKIIKKEMAKEETSNKEVIDVLADIIIPAAGVRAVANDTSLKKEVLGLAKIFRKALADEVSNRKTLFYA